MGDMGEQMDLKCENVIVKRMYFSSKIVFDSSVSGCNCNPNQVMVVPKAPKANQKRIKLPR